MHGGHIPFCFGQLGQDLWQMAVLLIVDKTYFSQILLLSEYKVCVRICRKSCQYLPHQEALSWLILAKGSTRKAGIRKVVTGAEIGKSSFYLKCQSFEEEFFTFRTKGIPLQM